MKITHYERPTAIINSNCRKTSKIPSASVSRNAEYDQLTIRQTPITQKSDEQFILSLKNQLSSEVKTGASQYKLDDLRRQVTLNEYDKNIADIARKILMDQEVLP